MLRMGRRDALVVQLAGQLADARAREAAALERLAWVEAALANAPALPPLRMVSSASQAPRSAARRTSR